ncbi:calcium/sodium antiporter [Cesiribacter andamanensis]|uniref:Inner membrane protein yrbG n=1 Tax=Cesiribacter andamanensis AMV16 TaxID=1279009 RepID=M7NBJ5_9BACT|nr:calcium/sodium antiporter [Cesiribacter andamanensis]EMR04632.1 Inner membrane protein yrbG [Cesiribacter andamanensis AMV16]
MFVKLLLLILGFALLLKGADWLVSGASALAKRYRISELAIGLTIVAFGTSAPELVVSVIGALDGHNEVVLGNVIGSNNFNLFIILGFAGLLQPLWVQNSTVWKEIPYSLLAAVLLWVLANDALLWGSPSAISRLDSLLLLLLFVLFLYYVYRSLRQDKQPSGVAQAEALPLQSNTKSILFIVLGLAGLVIGGRLVIDQALAIAHYLEVDERIIGLTVVAAGTSLPELATSVVAALRKRADIAVGNIIGSNVFNIFFVLGASALISPVSFDASFNLELVVLMAGTVFVFVAMFTGGRQRLDRWEAFFLLAIYLLYSYYFYTDGAGMAAQTFH